MTEIKKNVPLLPLRGLLVFPSMVLHIDVGQKRSVAALEHAMMNDNKIFLTAQKDLRIELPEKEDLYMIGTYVSVKQMLKLPNGTLRILVEGICRGKIINYQGNEDFTTVDVELHEDSKEKDAETEALMRTVMNYFEKYAESFQQNHDGNNPIGADIEEPGRFADIIASHLPFKIAEKQEILEHV